MRRNLDTPVHVLFVAALLVAALLVVAACGQLAPRAVAGNPGGGSSGSQLGGTVDSLAQVACRRHERWAEPWQTLLASDTGIDGQLCALTHTGGRKKRWPHPQVQSDAPPSVGAVAELCDGTFMGFGMQNGKATYGAQGNATAFATARPCVGERLSHSGLTLLRGSVSVPTFAAARIGNGCRALLVFGDSPKDDGLSAPLTWKDSPAHDLTPTVVTQGSVGPIFAGHRDAAATNVATFVHADTYGRIRAVTDIHLPGAAKEITGIAGRADDSVVYATPEGLWSLLRPHSKPQMLLPASSVPGDGTCCHLGSLRDAAGVGAVVVGRHGSDTLLVIDDLTGDLLTKIQVLDNVSKPAPILAFSVDMTLGTLLTATANHAGKGIRFTLLQPNFFMSASTDTQRTSP